MMQAGRKARRQRRAEHRSTGPNRHPARSHKARLAYSCGLLLAFGTGAAHAIGLGSIELASHLNERLDARIPVRELGGHQIDGVRVGLAPLRQFRELGIQYRPGLGQLQFTLEQDPAGGHVIRVRSPQPVVEPFVSFVLELRLPSGRMFREYTVLLDPPPPALHAGAIGDEPTAPARSVAPAAEPERSAVPADTAAALEPAASSQVNAGAAPPAAQGQTRGRHGPVAAGSSAWKIAAAVRPPGTSIYQTMIALFEANPRAFRDRDLNQLEAGAWLDIPSRDTVTAIPHQRAVALYAEHVAPSGEVATTVPATQDGTAHAAARSRAVPGDTAGTDTNRRATDLSGPFAAHASELRVAAQTRDAAVVPQTMAAYAGLRADVDRLETLLAGVRAQNATGAAAAQLEQRLDAVLAAQDDQAAALRADLGRLRAELADLRSRQGSITPGSGTAWGTGLTALLGVALGALGGFWGARSTMRRAAGAVPAAVPPADAGDDPEPVGPEVTGVRRTTAEMNENAPIDHPAMPGELVEGDREGAAAPAGDEGDEMVTASEPPASAEAPEGDAPGPGEDPETVPAGGADAGPDPVGSIPDEMEAEEILFGEADSEQASDFYHSLAKLYLASGWPSDAEALLRSTIEQKGDKAIYRVRILEALYQLGHRRQFLEDFAAYQAIADDDDPSWTWVRTMGRILWPDNAAFVDDGEDVLGDGDVADLSAELEADDGATLDMYEADMALQANDLGNGDPEDEREADDLEPIDTIDERFPDGSEPDDREGLDLDEVAGAVDEEGIEPVEAGDDDRDDIEPLEFHIEPDEPTTQARGFPRLTVVDTSSASDAGPGSTETAADDPDDHEGEEGEPEHPSSSRGKSSGRSR